MDIQARKYGLIQALIKLNDITVIEKLERILKNQLSSSEDWWNVISDEEKKAIDDGIAQIERGEVFSHEEVRSRINAKLGK